MDQITDILHQIEGMTDEEFLELTKQSAERMIAKMKALRGEYSTDLAKRVAEQQYIESQLIKDVMNLRDKWHYYQELELQIMEASNG
jgi:hypothetical protein